MLPTAGLVVGGTFSSRSALLTQEDIQRYAQEYDPQPFHLDAKLAETTLFAGLAGSGWHVAAITMRLLLEALPHGLGLIGTAMQLEWPSPSRPGDELCVKVVVEDTTPSRNHPARARVTLSCDTLNQRAEVRQRLRATVLVITPAGEQ